jgi:hypothetical protein
LAERPDRRGMKAAQKLRWRTLARATAQIQIIRL